MTELEQAADTAWAALLLPDNLLTRAFGGGPMPVAVAIDMVQNVTGDRDDAVTALHGAAWGWLLMLAPTGPLDDLATALMGHLLGEQYSLAENMREQLHHRTTGTRLSRILHPRDTSAAEAARADQWGAWCVHAKRAIEVCQAVSAAAYPIETTTGETTTGENL